MDKMDKIREEKRRTGREDKTRQKERGRKIQHTPSIAKMAAPPELVPVCSAEEEDDDAGAEAAARKGVRVAMSFLPVGDSIAPSVLAPLFCNSSPPLLLLLPPLLVLLLLLVLLALLMREKVAGGSMDASVDTHPFGPPNVPPALESADIHSGSSFFSRCAAKPSRLEGKVNHNNETWNATNWY